jgi:hypothetical protein
MSSIVLSQFLFVANEMLYENIYEPQSEYLANKTNSVALSLQENYIDWAAATCRRNVVPTFVDRGVSRGQRGGSPYGR